MAFRKHFLLRTHAAGSFVENTTISGEVPPK